jgi:UDP-hydrolysing UDP-N-acetyl-D-glucosamine 2-epimerase
MKISAVTSARSDFGLLLPLLRALQEHESHELTILATGVHFLPEFGNTIEEVRASEVSGIVVELPTLVHPDTSENCAKAIASGTAVFAERYSEDKPDLIVVLGDRFDVLPSVLAALPYQIPVAHISGGEVTEGAIDEYIRHVMSKLSHLHFTSTKDAARRVIQLGETPDRVFTVGEPGLDVIRNMTFEDRDAFIEEIGFHSDRPITLCTYHPETADVVDTGERIGILIAVAEAIDSQVLFTYPNGDVGSDEIVAKIEEACGQNNSLRCIPSLGRKRYLNALKHFDCVVGNSSSGIVESASFEIPVVDIGDRQLGRVRPNNVLHVSYDRAEIEQAWDRALSRSFRQQLKGIKNPYGDGRTVERIIAVLDKVQIGSGLWRKRFYDLGA